MLGNCAIHPDVPAAQTCERCGAFACGNCLEVTDTEPQQTLCANCYRNYFGEKASSRAVLAIVLSVLGLSMFCVFLGVPGWVLAEQELSAIERGEAPMKGRNLALGAKWLGIITTGVTVLAIGIGVLVGIGSAKRW